MKAENLDNIRFIINIDKGPMAMVRALINAGELFNADNVEPQLSHDDEMDWREVLWLHLKWESDED